LIVAISFLINGNFHFADRHGIPQARHPQIYRHHQDNDQLSTLCTARLVGKYLISSRCPFSYDDKNQRVCNREGGTAEQHNFRIAYETDGNRKRTVFKHLQPTAIILNISFFVPLDAQSKKKFKAMKQAQKEIALDPPPYHPSLRKTFHANLFMH
jgi:hypothetical protein